MTRRRIDPEQVAPWLFEVRGQETAGGRTLAALFPGHGGPIHLELGCGYGLFLRDIAALRPDHVFLGVEHDRGAALRSARQLMLAAVTNARVVIGDAYWVLHGLFGEGSIGDVFVNFPDPWPKRRHAARRFIRQPFVDALQRRMVPGHRVYLATDVATYATEMETLFDAHPGFVTRVPGGGSTHTKPTTVHSKYEQDFLSEGLPIYYLVYEARRMG
jgi:tRNA (guanine-N7-)-methyltransferase